MKDGYIIISMWANGNVTTKIMPAEESVEAYKMARETCDVYGVARVWMLSYNNYRQEQVFMAFANENKSR